MNEKIHSVTVTFNPVLDVLFNHIYSLKNQVEKLIIVDNGSDNIDDIVSMVNSINNVLLVFQNENVGLAKAQNIGVETSISLGAEYFILFDQDSVVDEYFVTGLKLAYDDLSSKGVLVGAVGPSFYDSVSNDLYPPTKYWGPFIRNVNLGLATSVSFLIASGCFIPKQSFLAIGAMREELFVDYIDVEWSFRARSLGYIVVMTNQAKMSHAIGDSRISIFGRTVSVHSPLRRYFLIRNSFYMLRLSYVSFGYKVREIIFNVIRFVISLIFSANKVQTIRYSAKGFFHGVLNKYGPYK